MEEQKDGGPAGPVEPTEPTSHAAPTTPRIRLHLLAIPHTITRDEFSHCAFTGKVQRLAPMMRSRGFEVFHYGVETSQSGADKDVNLLTVDEWKELRIQSYIHLHPDETRDAVVKKLEDPTSFIGDLGNWDTPLYKEFNRRARVELIKNYRSTATDLLCLPFGPAHEEAFKNLSVVPLESGIGYNNAKHNFRVYESYAMLHTDIEKSHKAPPNYFFMAPNYYNLDEWRFQPTAPVKPLIGFFGRIGNTKGCHIIVEIARAMPHVDFILCGQGDPKPYVGSKNVEGGTGPENVHYKAPIHGKDRADYLCSLTALVAPR